MTYVFIHGLGQTSSSWDSVIAHLPSDINIYRPCLSTIVKDGQITYEKLYSAFESECSLLETPLFLCGISLGAILALQFTLNNPQQVQSLILIAPQYKTPKLLLDIQNIVFRILPQESFASMGFSKKDMISLTSSMKKLDFTRMLNRITCQTLILCGQKDRMNQSAARALSNTIPNAKLSFIQCAGHEVNIDAPITLAELIKDIIL